MSYTKSMVLAVPADHRDECNRLMEAFGRGPNTFSVAAVAIGSNVVVSYWAHTYDDEIAAAFDEWALPSPANLDQYGFTEESALEAMTHIRYRALEGADGYQNFVECMGSEGVQLFDGTEPEPEPEKGLLARIGSTIMSFFAPTDLEGQI